MKKIFFVSLLTLLLAFVFVSPVAAQGEVPQCDPLVDPECAASTEPTIPLTVDQFPWVSVLLVGAVTFVVTLGVKSLDSAFGVDISGQVTALTGTIVLTLVNLINQLLANIPPEAIPSVTAGIGFVFTLLSAFGLAGLLKKITGSKG